MINKIKKYLNDSGNNNIILSEKQEKMIIDYFFNLKKLFKKENVDLEAYYDLENNIIEKLLSKNNDITDEYIKSILDELGTPEEIVEPFKNDNQTILDELKQIFPINGDNKELLKYYGKLLLKIIGWIGIGLGTLGIIKFFILSFVNISLFNIDITGSIPLFLKIFTLVFSLFVISISTYLISFKKSKLRNYFVGFLFLVIICISVFGGYKLSVEYNSLNTFSYSNDLKLDSGKKYEIGDINLFGPLEGNVFYSILTKELTKNYIHEYKNTINIVNGNELKITSIRNILGNKDEALKFNNNISDLVIKLIGNKIYIYRKNYFFKKETRIIPFLPKIKIELPKNIILNNNLDMDK